MNQRLGPHRREAAWHHWMVVAPPATQQVEYTLEVSDPDFTAFP